MFSKSFKFWVPRFCLSCLHLSVQGVRSLISLRIYSDSSMSYVKICVFQVKSLKAVRVCVIRFEKEVLVCLLSFYECLKLRCLGSPCSGKGRDSKV
jgi:hypothetical protein